MLRSRHTITASLASQGSWQSSYWQSVSNPRTRHRYCGKEKDAESGLYYYGAGYYESWTCRFVSVDPLTEKAMHIQPYAYCHNNPINYIDPTGAETIDDQAKHDNITGDPTVSKYSNAMKGIFENSQKSGGEKFSPSGDCYAVTFERVKAAYFKAHGKSIESDYPKLKSKNARDVMSTNITRAKDLLSQKDDDFNTYFGFGVPGALAYAGVEGRLVFDKEIKEKGIGIGGPLQYWWDNDYEKARQGDGGYGHAGIAMGNKFDANGKLLLMRFWDQGILNDTKGSNMPGTLWKYGATKEMLPFVGINNPNIDSFVRTYFGFPDNDEPGTYPISEWPSSTLIDIASKQKSLYLVGFEFR